MWTTPDDPDAPAAFPSLPVTATVTLPDTLDETKVAMLARQVAMDINDIATILAHFNLSAEQFAIIQKFPLYIKVLDQEQAAWKSAENATERLRLKAQAILEETLPTLGARMLKPAEALPAVTETGKLMARIAGMGERNDAPVKGEKFSINIVIGGEGKIVKEVTPNVPLLESSAAD